MTLILETKLQKRKKFYYITNSKKNKNEALRNNVAELEVKIRFFLSKKLKSHFNFLGSQI